MPRTRRTDRASTRAERKVIKEKGYLPADYLERPANHRASILKLPDLTDDDIGEFYDRFTALRRSLYAARYGVAPPEELAGATDHVDKLAHTG